jgi:uncharacterized metal-binding protein
MPELPKRKVGVVACSGEELPEGTVTRLSALQVLGELRPAQTVTICLPLFLAGGEGDRAFARFYPTITVDGCERRCAARATELYSNRPAASLVVPDFVAAHGLPAPTGRRQPSAASQEVATALAAEIAARVDALLAVSWSRSQGTFLTATDQEPVRDEDRQADITSAPCACGSGVPMTTVALGERKIQVLALEPVMAQAYGQGLRATVDIANQIMPTVRIYNAIATADDEAYLQAVELAWRAYCGHQAEAARG